MSCSSRSKSAHAQSVTSERAGLGATAMLPDIGATFFALLGEPLRRDHAGFGMPWVGVLQQVVERSDEGHMCMSRLLESEHFTH